MIEELFDGDYRKVHKADWAQQPAPQDNPMFMSMESWVIVDGWDSGVIEEASLFGPFNSEQEAIEAGQDLMSDYWTIKRIYPPSDMDTWTKRKTEDPEWYADYMGDGNVQQ